MERIQTVRLRLGDSFDLLQEYPEGAFSFIVSDPPYGLEYMSKSWDNLGKFDWNDGGGMSAVGMGRAIPWPSYSAGAAGTANATCEECGGRMRGEHVCSCEEPKWRVRGEPLDLAAHARRMKAQEEWHVQWLREAFRILPESGVVKAFGGSRTFHRLAKAMGEVGFPNLSLEAWLYGSGFPKSTNLGKSLDKLLGAVRTTKKVSYSPNAILRTGGQNTRPWMEKALEAGFHELQGDEPSSPEAKMWDGWGTALKPSWEPVMVARKTPRLEGAPSLRVLHVLRKPLSEGSITKNVLKHGTGGLNIRASLIETDANLGGGAYSGGTRKAFAGDLRDEVGAGMYGAGGRLSPEAFRKPAGRWPANLLLLHEKGCVPETCSETCPVRALNLQTSGNATEGAAEFYFQSREG